MSILGTYKIWRKVGPFKNGNPFPVLIENQLGAFFHLYFNAVVVSLSSQQTQDH